MGTLLLSTVVAMALSLQPTEAKNDTIEKYLIDGQKIEHFLGQELEGKTIYKYKIGYKTTGNVVEKTHIIITNKEAFEQTTENNTIRIRGDEKDIQYIIDGKPADKEAMDKLDPNKIASIAVLKSKGIIDIKTKK